MKITKKAFCEAMTANKTAFIGVTKRLYSEDEVFCCISDSFSPEVILELRTCEARSKSLIFNNGSILDFNQIGKYTFEKYEYNEGFVLVCVHTYFDDWEECDKVKAMYYLVRFSDN